MMPDKEAIEGAVAFIQAQGGTLTPPFDTLFRLARSYLEAMEGVPQNKEIKYRDFNEEQKKKDYDLGYNAACDEWMPKYVSMKEARDRLKEQVEMDKQYLEVDGEKMTDQIDTIKALDEKIVKLEAERDDFKTALRDSMLERDAIIKQLSEELADIKAGLREQEELN